MLPECLWCARWRRAAYYVQTLAMGIACTFWRAGNY